MDARKFVFTLIHDPLSDRFLEFPQILHTFQNSQRMDERAARMEERRSLVHQAARMEEEIWLDRIDWIFPEYPTLEGERGNLIVGIICSGLIVFCCFFLLISLFVITCVIYPNPIYS